MPRILDPFRLCLISVAKMHVNGLAGAHGLHPIGVEQMEMMSGDLGGAVQDAYVRIGGHQSGSGSKRGCSSDSSAVNVPSTRGASWSGWHFSTLSIRAHCELG